MKQLRPATPTRQWWLMKTEPDEFSIEDLLRQGSTPWSGVRNYQARNFMRDSMRVDDGVLVYHSSCEVPAVVGLGRIASQAQPDPLQFDLKSEYADPSSPRDNPRWLKVDVAFQQKFKRPVTLEAIRATPELAGMLVVQRGMRLSIQPVDPHHAAHIIEMAGP
jgi:predicted RNA-binding protein with PUA-like domain